MKNKILNLLKTNKQMLPGEIAKELNVNSTKEFKQFVVTLNELEDERLIHNDHDQYVLIDGEEWIAGRVRDVSPFEYAVFDQDKKVYVSKAGTDLLMDRDEVLVHKTKQKTSVVRIYQRGVTNIVGKFIKYKNRYEFYSDVDLHTSFKVTNKADFKLKPGIKAVVKVQKYQKPLVVEIVEILGFEDQAGVDVTAILTQNDVRQHFMKKVKHACDQIPSHVYKKEMKGRHDLRNLLTVTIDGETTKDFDDAISVEKLRNGGWKLYVHIADVSYYVSEGDPIDEEAYKRGTSIYVADRVVPMLPFVLSNGICSLNPDVDRLTLTCEMDFDAKGKRIGYSIYDSVIRSDARCTYGKVNEYLENPDSVEEYKEFGPMLLEFSNLAKKLNEQTIARGHILFETQEPYYVLDEKGMPIDVYVKEHGWSEQMIEEAMVAANVTVAHELVTHEFPGMYRVHEQPDPQKLQSVVNLARILHCPCQIDPDQCEPIDIAQFLDSIQDENTKEILSSVALRSMQKARYSQENLGHYGLALEEYCHFTSPIRRYPDLLIHRMIRRHILEKKNDEKTLNHDRYRMEKAALHLSQKERDAVTVERAVNDLEATKFMQNKVGQMFEGVISGVTSFGFFVSLDNSIEGLVPLRKMVDDFYQYDEDTMTLTGESTGKVFRLGTRVQVEVVEASVPKRQITFAYIANVF